MELEGIDLEDKEPSFKTLVKSFGAISTELLKFPISKWFTQRVQFNPKIHATEKNKWFSPAPILNKKIVV